MVLDLGRFFYKITPFCPFAYIFPSSPVFDFLKTKGNWRFWGYGTASIPSNYNLIFGLFSAEGYDPLYPRWYGEFIRRSEDGQAKMAIRSDAVIAPGFGRDDFARNKSRQEILRLLGVRYLLGREENQSDQTTFPPTDYKLVWQEDNWRVYEDLRVTNRAWLIESGTAEIEGYEPLSVQIRAKTAQDNLLVISDTDYPGWQARIDGREVPVTRIEGVFKGVKVLAGEHVIHFFYRPKSFWLGLRITLFCLGGWLVGLFLYIIIKKT
jgi:hypothetical protein